MADDGAAPASMRSTKVVSTSPGLTAKVRGGKDKGSSFPCLATKGSPLAYLARRSSEKMLSKCNWVS